MTHSALVCHQENISNIIEIFKLVEQGREHNWERIDYRYSKNNNSFLTHEYDFYKA